MLNRLITPALAILLVTLFLPLQGQSDDTLTAAEQRLSDDLRAMPVPEDARFNEQMTHEFVMMMLAGAPTDDPQMIFPGLRIVLYAVPRSCASLESFYQQHWEKFEFQKQDTYDLNRYVAFLRWQGETLQQDPEISVEEIDDAAEGVAIMATDVPASTGDSPGQDMTREQYGFPDDIGYCAVFMINSRRVDLSDIPLSMRGLSPGQVYSSVSGLFNTIVPSAGNFLVNRYFVVEASEDQGDTFVEEVSFVIPDFGELYRVGIVRRSGKSAEIANDDADALARIPLSRHYLGELPGEAESIDNETLATVYGPGVKALFRVEKGSQLIEIADLQSPESSTASDALIAVTAIPVGDYLIFSSAQNDFLARADDQSYLIASVHSQAGFLIDYLTWSRDLPGDVMLPASVKAPQKVPHLEHCLVKSHDAGGLAFRNTCEQPIAFQIVVDQAKYDVAVDTIEGGETLRFVDAPAWYTFAACPSGYEADKPFDADNMNSLRASQYNCGRSGAIETLDKERSSSSPAKLEDVKAFLPAKERLVERMKAFNKALFDADYATQYEMYPPYLRSELSFDAWKKDLGIGEDTQASEPLTLIDSRIDEVRACMPMSGDLASGPYRCVVVVKVSYTAGTETKVDQLPQSWEFIDDEWYFLMSLHH